jgi:hypothetical protein
MWCQRDERADLDAGSFADALRNDPNAGTSLHIAEDRADEARRVDEARTETQLADSPARISS